MLGAQNQKNHEAGQQTGKITYQGLLSQLLFVFGSSDV
jgi:hypothetical protein